MPDITYNQFPISGKIVDFDTLQSDVNNLNANAVLESRTINGYDLSENRTIYAQDVPSKNLLPNTTSSVTGNGVTVTVNSDGSVTVNGTATANITFYFVGSDSSTYSFDSGTYIVSDEVESGDSANRHVFVNYYEGGTYRGQANTYNTPQFTLGSGYAIRCGLYITSGTTVSNVTFYPMIRPSTAPAGYVPYAKTNVELSKIESKTPSPVISRISSMTGVIHKSGEICHVNVKLTSNATATNSPQVVNALPNAICDSALTAIDITSGIGSAITDAIPCGVSEGGVMYLQTITSGHIYAITGSYICK